MTSKVFLAHTAKDGRVQTLREHLIGTAALAKEFGDAFYEGELAELSGLAHDLGKYSDKFQARIRGENIRVDHATAGSQELFTMGQPQAAFCVAGHHGGLPDGGNRCDSGGEPTFFGRMKKPLCSYGAWREELSLPTPEPPKSRGSVGDAMFTRMLYSCLVDADYLDTERFMWGGNVVRPGGEPLAELRKRLDAYIEAEGFLRPVGAVNELRAGVLRSCIRGGELPPGLFSLTVPTGGGKTVASLAFALRHALG